MCDCGNHFHYSASSPLQNKAPESTNAAPEIPKRSYVLALEMHHMFHIRQLSMLPNYYCQWLHLVNPQQLLVCVVVVSFDFS